MHVRAKLAGPLARVTLMGALVSSLASPLHADWTQTSGPTGGLVRSLAAVPDGSGGARIFAGQIYVWRTDDGGEDWTRLTSGLTHPNAFALLPVPNGAGGHDLLVGTGTGVFRSSDGGATWSPINNGLPANSVYALAAGPNGSGGIYLYAGMYLGQAFRSGDGGASWTAIQSGLPTGYNVNALTTTDAGTVLIGTMNGIYRSTNFGASWTRVFTLYGFSFAKHGGVIYAGTSNGVYRSTNDGASWTPINAGLGFTWVYAMAAVPNGSGVTLYAGAGGVLRSADGGASWIPASSGLPPMAVYALAAAPDGGGGTHLYAGTPEGVFRSSDGGIHWTNASFVYSGVQGLEVTPAGTILAATENDVFRSTDLGTIWTDTQANTTMLDFAVNPHGGSGVSLFAGGSPSGIFKSTNDGASWTSSSNALDDFDVNSVGAIPSGSGGTHLLAGTYSGLFRSTNDGASWHRVNLETLTLDYVVTPAGAFAGGFGGVWQSTDHGATWLPRNAGLTDRIVQALAATGGGANLFAAGDPFGVMRSTDGGVTWTAVNEGLTDLRVFALLTTGGTHLFAGGAGGVYLSSDHGAHWTPVGDGLATGVFALALSADGQTLIAGTTGLGVWKRALSELIGVTDVPVPRAAGLSLRPQVPNPFRSLTTIHYSLPRTARARLTIYDVTGRAVRTLVDGVQEAGERVVRWDGTGRDGSRVVTGVYVVRLEAEGVSLARKVTLLN